MFRSFSSHLNRIVYSPHFHFTVLLAGILLFSFWLRLRYLRNFPWGYDEGIHVLLARLLAAGYAPYSELFVSYPPLFVWSLEWPWRIWGTVEALQLLMTIYALLGVMAVGIVAFRLGGTLAGSLAAIFLSVSATYLAGSRAVMTEVPSVGVATLAIVLAALYTWAGQRGWLLVSGLVMSASLMLKILSPFVLGLIPLMILVHHIQQRKLSSRSSRQTFIIGLKSLLNDLLIWGIGLLLPVVLVLLLYNASAMVRQVIVFRLDTRTAYQEDWTENINMLFQFVGGNPALILAAVCGVAIILLKKQQDGWFVLVWLALAVIFGLLQVPLREKHLPLLLPPLAVLGGLGLGWSLARLGRLPWGLDRSGVAVASALMAGLLLILYAGQVWREFSFISRVTTRPLNDEDRMLSDYLQKFTAPNDCLVTDNPTLAFYAERLVPPNLSEVSSARLRAGYLTYDELVAATQDNSCQVVAPISTRLKRTRTDFVDWSKQNFVGLWLYDGEAEVLLAQPLQNPQPTYLVGAILGEQVELIGYDMIETEAETGRSLYVSLYWRALQPFAEDYTIFVHVRDTSHQTVVNGDHLPYDGRAPTSRWPVGRAVKETIRLPIPSDLPPGEYRVMVGMYSPITLERLPVQADISGENAIILQPFYNQ
jgi:hypothetical protein